MGTFLLGILVVVNVVLLVLLAAIFRRISGSSQTTEITDLAEQTALLHQSLSQKFNDATRRYGHPAGEHQGGPARRASPIV